MAHRLNPRQLVLRRDTATGLTQVGWESDLPIGRFEHLELVCELDDIHLPDAGSKHYHEYQAACRRALQANIELLDLQSRSNEAKGWLLIPFELVDDEMRLRADAFGNCFAAAMQLMFYLTANIKDVWAVIQKNQVTHIRPRQPRKALDELSYQVWRHQQQHQLAQYQGEISKGRLVVQESGLWFIPEA